MWHILCYAYYALSLADSRSVNLFMRFWAQSHFNPNAWHWHWTAPQHWHTWKCTRNIWVYLFQFYPSSFLLCIYKLKTSQQRVHLSRRHSLRYFWINSLVPAYISLPSFSNFSIALGIPELLYWAGVKSFVLPRATWIFILSFECHTKWSALKLACYRCADCRGPPAVALAGPNTINDFAGLIWPIGWMFPLLHRVLNKIKPI